MASCPTPGCTRDPGHRGMHNGPNSQGAGKRRLRTNGTVASRPAPPPPAPEPSQAAPLVLRDPLFPDDASLTIHDLVDGEIYLVNAGDKWTPVVFTEGELEPIAPPMALRVAAAAFVQGWRAAEEVLAG